VVAAEPTILANGGETLTTGGQQCPKQWAIPPRGYRFRTSRCNRSFRGHGLDLPNIVVETRLRHGPETAWVARSGFLSWMAESIYDSERRGWIGSDAFGHRRRHRIQNTDSLQTTPRGTLPDGPRSELLNELRRTWRRHPRLTQEPAAAPGWSEAFGPRESRLKAQVARLIAPRMARRGRRPALGPWLERQTTWRHLRRRPSSRTRRARMGLSTWTSYEAGFAGASAKKP